MTPSNSLKMRAATLVRRVNEAGFGSVLSERRLKTHRLSDINTVDGKSVDLLKYAAWLTFRFFQDENKTQDYKERKRKQAEKNAEEVRAAQDIGPLPEVVDPERKKAALKSFRVFCETYFGEVFYLPWSDDHLRVIKKIERSVTKGGLFAMAMPRGSGKALALDTPIPTIRDGFIIWKRMENVKVGDFVLNERGEPCRVEFATEVMHDHPCFEIEVTGGEKIVCDAEHLWRVYNGTIWETRRTDTLACGFHYRLPPSYPIRENVRYIESVRPVPSVPVKCIQVDSPKKLYLAGKSFVPTHNTVLCQTAVAWAALSGATPFVCLIAASAERGKDLLENIKTWLETNELLQADFPEVCFPIQCLERIAKAVTGATGKEFEDLTEKAKFLGRTTSFTASQVASAMLELGRAGFDSKEIDEAIPSVLNLARATGTELATSAEICANTLRSFGLPASEMVRVSDVMVAAANNSAQTLEDLGESMSYCAPIASEYGLSLESTAKSLGALANYGIKGSQAGTTLRRVLTNLADPKIQKKLQGIGVAVVDQNTGKMREVSEVLRDVGAATQSMPKDQKLGFFKQLFGLYAIAGGAKLTVAQFDKLNEAVDNAAGTGARAAKEMDAGIGGSLRMMWSAIEGVAIAVGEALAPALQKMTDWFTSATSGMVDYLTKNKQIVVQAAKIVSIITGVGVGLFALGAAFIGVGKTIGVVATMIASVAKVGLLGFSILSGAISAVTMTVGTVVSAFSGVAGMIGMVFGGVATAVGTALSVLATIGTAVFGAVGAAIAAAFSPLGLVLISLGAVAGACFLVYRNASAIGNAISTVFSGITGAVKNAASSVYAFLNRFTEFRIIFGTINIVRGGLNLLGKTILWIGNSIVKPTFSVIFGVFRQLAGVVVTVSKTVGSALVAGFGKILDVVQKVFRGVVSVVATVAGKAVSIVGGIFSGIASVIGRVLSPVLNIIGTVFQGILKFISPIGTALKTVAGWIVSFARSFFVVESAIQVFSLLSTATRGAASLFSTMAGTAISAIFSIASAVPGVVSSVVRFFFTLPGQILNVFSQIPRIVGGAFSTAVGVVKTVVSGIGNVFSGIATFASNIFNGLVSVFSTVFNTLGGIVSGFGNFFLGAFTNVGVAVDWLREQFGNLLSFASETVGAIAAALGQGDIEAAIGVVWAAIKLIWTQGTTSLVSTWHWLTETLQTTWATCVFKISELLTTAWYGVQEFWTETVYTMSTLWTEFSSNVVSAWKTAEQAIAQGIGWIIAKMEGLDPNEMANIINEDYNRQSQQREAQKSQALTGIQKNRDDKMSSLKSEKDGTLDILKSDFEKSAGTRDAAYQTKLAAQQKELDAAKAAYDEAINRAKNPPQTPQAEESQSLAERLQTKVQEAIKGFSANTDLGSKVSVSGSFSAAAVASMGASSVMDRVAKATEKSEKHLQKIADKNDSDGADTEIPDEPDEGGAGEETAMSKELRQQTRYLRDIAQGSRAFA